MAELALPTTEDSEQITLNAQVASAVSDAQAAIGNRNPMALEAALFRLSTLAARHNDASAMQSNTQSAIADVQLSAAQIQAETKTLVAEAVKQEVITQKRGDEILSSFPSAQVEVADQAKAVQAEMLVTANEPVKTEKAAEPGRSPVEIFKAEMEKPELSTASPVADLLAQAKGGDAPHAPKDHSNRIRDLLEGKVPQTQPVTVSR